MKSAFSFALVCALIFAPLKASTCTTFAMGTGANAFVGKSYDWEYGTGMLVINKRNVEKTAVSFDAADTAAKWVSKHSSVTFNQFGREFPMGGMNDKGLVVEIMWLEESTYPESGKKALPVVNQAQWVQYILDTSASVEEAVKQASLVRVVALMEVPVHYLVCERTGQCAAFEYLNKKLVVSRDTAQGKVRALTNDTYKNSAAALKRYQGFGGVTAVPEKSQDSLERFAIANHFGRPDKSAHATAATGFEILERVRWENYTQWHIVYDQTKGVVSYRSEEAREIKEINLATIPASCATPVKMIDLADANVKGDITQTIQDYDTAAARAVLEKNPDLSQVPMILEMALQYPDTTKCLD